MELVFVQQLCLKGIKFNIVSVDGKGCIPQPMIEQLQKLKECYPSSWQFFLCNNWLDDVHIGEAHILKQFEIDPFLPTLNKHWVN